MRTVNGKYNSAKVFTDNVEDTCIEQIQGLLDQEAFGGAKVRIMPDCHAGKGCVIGFMADMGDKIIPNIVDNIGETAEMILRLRPVYNFKASSTRFGKEE